MKFDKQKIFNKVATHLLKQNEKALNCHDACQYRGDGGTSCALGCLIPDDLYAKRLEGHSIRGSVLDDFDSKFLDEEDIPDPEFKKIVYRATGAKSVHDFVFLACLQSLHDNDEPNEWADELKGLARRYKLKMPSTLKKAKEVA